MNGCMVISFNGVYWHHVILLSVAVCILKLSCAYLNSLPKDYS